MTTLPPNHPTPLTLEHAEGSGMVYQIGRIQVVVLMRGRGAASKLVIPANRQEERACRLLCARGLMRPHGEAKLKSFQVTQLGNSCWVRIQ